MIDFFAGWGFWLLRIVILALMFVVFNFLYEKIRNIGMFISLIVLSFVVHGVFNESSIAYEIFFMIMWLWVACAND